MNETRIPRKPRLVKPGRRYTVDDHPQKPAIIKAVVLGAVKDFPEARRRLLEGLRAITGERTSGGETEK